MIDGCLVVPHRVVAPTIAPARQNPPLALHRTLRRPAHRPHAQHGPTRKAPCALPDRGVGGVGELAAVGVLAAFRRRGVASALSVHLARTAHTRGIGLVFLEAEPGEEQLYRRTGFTDATTKIWTSLR